MMSIGKTVVIWCLALVGSACSSAGSDDAVSGSVRVSAPPDAGTLAETVGASATDAATAVNDDATPAPASMAGATPIAPGNLTRGGTAPATVAVSAAVPSFTSSAQRVLPPIGAEAGAPARTGRRLAAPIASAAVGSAPCTAAQMTNHGGPVIATPVVNVLWWGRGAPDPTLKGEWTALASAPAFWSRLREYGIGLGSYGADFVAPGAPTGNASKAETLSNTVIEQTIGEMVGTATLSDPSQVVVVALPAYTYSAYDGGQPGCHHLSFAYGSGGSSTRVRYVVLAGTGEAEFGREIAGVVTNPDGWAGAPAWTDATSSRVPREVGDVCDRLADPTAPIMGYRVSLVWSQLACSCVGRRDLGAGDALGTGLPTPTVWRATSTVGVWLPNASELPFWEFGAGQGDRIGFGDFDGDGIAEDVDIDPAGAEVHVLDTRTGVVTTTDFSALGDTLTLAAGDYDGDGKTDVAVWGPATGFTIIASQTGRVLQTPLGEDGDVPVPGDYDGDFVTDYAVFRASTGAWMGISSATGEAWTFAWTVPASAIPVAKDFDGDGRVDFAFFDSGAGGFSVSLSGASAAFQVPWGAAGDVPVVEDWDGDWAADPAVWRPSTGEWLILTGSGGAPPSPARWGQAGDVPAQGR